MYSIIASVVAGHQDITRRVHRDGYDALDLFIRVHRDETGSIRLAQILCRQEVRREGVHFVAYTRVLLLDVPQPGWTPPVWNIYDV